jgi:hypothetical protein
MVEVTSTPPYVFMTCLIKPRDMFVFTIPVNSTLDRRGREVGNFIGNRSLRSVVEWKLKQSEETGAIEGPFVETVWPWQAPFCW